MYCRARFIVIYIQTQQKFWSYDKIQSHRKINDDSFFVCFKMYLCDNFSTKRHFLFFKCVYIYLSLSEKKECLFTKPFFLNLRNQLLICNISNNCKSQLIEKLSVVTNFPLKLPSVVEFLYFKTFNYLLCCNATIKYNIKKSTQVCS